MYEDHPPDDVEQLAEEELADPGRCTAIGSGGGGRCHRQSIPGDVVCSLHTEEALAKPHPLTGRWNPARRCTATAKHTGERCARQPIPGGFVCVLHGGAIPVVQASAQRRLLAGADLAIDHLLHLLTPKNTCERCGRSDADRDPVVVRACQLVLDRSGFGPTATMKVEASDESGDLSGLSLDDLIARAEATVARLRAMRDAELIDADDGLLLDDGSPLDDNGTPGKDGDQ